MAFIVINDDKENKEQMRSNMSMRRHYRGGSPGSGGAFRGSYRAEEAYKEGYTHGWRDHEDEMEEEYRRSRDSHGRYV